MALSLGRKAMVAALATTTLMVAGCATETRYRPATGQGFNRQGYSERMIEPGRFLVSFAGNSVTSRDTVERYLFYRAAELTLQQGFDYFVMADRDTNLQSRTFSTPGIGGPWGYGGFGGYWGPSWRYYGRGFGWRGWDPFFGDPFWDRGVDVRTVERYEASAEIIVGRGPKPAGNVRAFDARDVVDRLGPSIQLPEDRRR